MHRKISEHFRGKKITIMGLGLLGRGVGDAAFLASCGADLIITDLKLSQELQPSLVALAGYSNITYSLGQHRLEDFCGRDLILRAAGVPETSPFLAAARAQGIPVRMSADLFAELSGLPIIGVTGTRGKTTTTTMIHAILQAAGVNALLGGNIMGVSTLALLRESATAAVAVLELDSWQLQGFGALQLSPHIAVFTTFYEDHQAYYRNDMDRYLRDKAQVFLHQSAQDTLIVGAQALPSIAVQYPEVVQRVVCASVPDIADWHLIVPGMHNRYNAACARAAAKAFGVDDVIIRQALGVFPGVPGRLELVGEKLGVRVYNDTTAVIPEATCAGLEALASAPIILIMGGGDKGNKTDTLVAATHRHTKQVVLLPGTGSDGIAKKLPRAVRTDSMYAAVAEALRIAVPGDVILFSPAFSSLGLYENVFDRGKQFMNALQAVWTN